MSAVLVSYSQTLAVINEDHCIGCSLCIKACPFDAIIGTAKQMHAVIDVYCTGCKLCIAPCPVDCISMQPNSALDKLTPIQANFSSHTACTHCDRCQPACPSQLNPESLYQSISQGKIHQAEKNSVSACTTCGECDNVCPSNIPLSNTFAYANKILQFKANKKTFARDCKQRMENREIRLKNKKQHQQSFLSNNKQQLSEKLQTLKNAAIKNSVN